MRGRDGSHASEVAFDIGPRQTLPWFFHRHNNTPSGIGPVEHQLTAPNQRTLLPIRIDPERVATDSYLLRSIARTHREDPRMQPRQTRDETRLLGMKVFQDDTLVVAQFVELLIGRRVVEKRRVDLVWQRLTAQVRDGERVGVNSKTF